jgi:RNA ligase (TIGR02306 family)
MSEHRVPIIEVSDIRPHAGADRLEIVVVGGWQAVIRKGQFALGDRAVYIEPDYVVPTSRPEFSFLAKEGRDSHRLKAVRLRGELSFGLLIPVPPECESMPVGSNVMGVLGISRHEPPAADVNMHADELSVYYYPPVISPKFDVESLHRYSDLIAPGDPVIVTEKIHGVNARYVFADGKFYMGSRNRWIRPDASHVWSAAAQVDPRIENWCRRHAGVVLYGEVYGSVQSMKYGTRKGEVLFAAFAAIDAGRWLPSLDVLGDKTIPIVPILFNGAYDPAIVLPLAECNSVVSTKGGDLMEGIVIDADRYNGKIGRVVLKHISNRYWESNE